MLNSDRLYDEAIALKARILNGRTNETAVQAWASVARCCAKADAAKRAELAGKPYHSTGDNRWFANLDRVWDAAKAQVETLARA